jgi:uncharacterized membrane protein
MRTQGLPWRRVAGGTLIVAATIPALMRWVRRIGAARRTVDMRMTLVIERPIADVFEFCRDFENFPRIVDVLLSVEDTQDGRSHWAVRSPTGQVIEWDATVTKYVPNSVIAWESAPGSPAKASGLMRFYTLGDSETRVDMSLTYVPMHTGLSEALRALIGPSNNQRVRSEVANASQTLARLP